MSLRTPILTTSPEISAEAVALSVKAAAMPKIAASFIGSSSDKSQNSRVSPLSASKGGEGISRDLQSISCRPSHPEIVVQLVGVPRDILVADHVDDLPVLDDIVAVGEGRGEVKILLDQKDREALMFQLTDQPANLLDDDRRQALGRLVEQKQRGGGAHDPAHRQH